jgi:hypothetical protein
MKWSDLLRVKAEFPVNLWPNAAQAYHHWIVTSLRATICPTISSPARCSRQQRQQFRVGPVNFYRAVQSKEPATLARTVALTFMGERAEKWPDAASTRWPLSSRKLTYKATGEWKEEIVFFDPNKPQPAGDAPSPKFPDGTPATLSPDRDGREIFANWLVAPQNPWFARVMANRVWSWLLGRGIVHEPDDFRTDNPPTNPALLDHLAAEFVAAHFDVKQLMRLILNSQTYQLSSLARSTQPEAEAFAFYAPRRLDAEVLIDALNQITGTTKNIPAPFPSPSPSSPKTNAPSPSPMAASRVRFSKISADPSRDTGLESERNNRITASQRLTLLNSTLVQRKLEQGPKIQALLRTRNAPRETIDALYLTILSRPPTADELRIVQQRALAGPDGRTAAIDLAWALINSAEFLYRH